MGLGLALVICLLIFVAVGFVIFQARFAARHWRREVAGGNQEVLGQLLEMTFDGWRNGRPPRGMPPADWRALHTAALLAADQDRVRVSLLAEPDIRVVGGRRVETGSAHEVTRRVAVRMVERLLYEVPHVSFDAVQVDVLTEFRTPDGAVTTPCLLSTRVTREVASWSDWEQGTVEDMLAEWDTREATDGRYVDPDQGAILDVDQIAADQAVREAERALRDRADGGPGEDARG